MMVDLGSLSGAACCHPIELPPYEAAPLQTLGLRSRCSLGGRERSAEAPCAVDAPARPRDGGANQAVTTVHDSYRAPYPDLYLSLPRSDCDRGTLVPRFLAEPKTQKTGLALHGPVHDLCLYFRRQNQ